MLSGVFESLGLGVLERWNIGVLKNKTSILSSLLQYFEINQNLKLPRWITYFWMIELQHLVFLSFLIRKIRRVLQSLIFLTC